MLSDVLRRAVLPVVLPAQRGETPFTAGSVFFLQAAGAQTDWQIKNSFLGDEHGSLQPCSRLLQPVGGFLGCIGGLSGDVSALASQYLDKLWNPLDPLESLGNSFVRNPFDPFFGSLAFRPTIQNRSERQVTDALGMPTWTKSTEFHSLH